MIHMPKKSVTRFFVPLIDVLLLLFCIFLLMPIADEQQLDNTRAENGDLNEKVASQDYQLGSMTSELDTFEELRPQLAEFSKVKKELDDLKEQLRKDLKNRAGFKIIDIDATPKGKGKISYYDPNKGRIEIDNEKAAHALIERHKKEAANEKKELYYIFNYPRPPSKVYPTALQEKRYNEWFAGVANSLKEN